MAKFEHDGIEIELKQDGRFAASIGGKLVRKPSLDAMKKAIDESKKVKFEPFEGLIRAGWEVKEYMIEGTELARVKIVGVEKIKYRRDGREQFYFVWKSLDGKKGGTSGTVYRSAQEAIEAETALESFKQETRRIETERREQQGELTEKLSEFLIDPEQFSEK